MSPNKYLARFGVKCGIQAHGQAQNIKGLNHDSLRVRSTGEKCDG